MTATELVYFICLFSFLLILSIVFNGLFLKFSKTLGAKNETGPQVIRWSNTRKPALGGISFYLVFLFSFVLFLYFVNPRIDTLNPHHLGILLAVTLGFFTGLADDAYNTVPWLKFSAQVMTGGILLFFGIRIDFFASPLANDLLTIAWTVGIMNSINMLDNMDGITSVTSLFILLQAAICALPLNGSNLFYTYVCGGTVAAILGFLYFNWHPSRMFMGDTGSQLLGALLAAVGVLYFWNCDGNVSFSRQFEQISIILCAFAIPLADTTVVVINRMLRKSSPFVGGKDHTTHHLSYLGLKDNQVAMVFIAISVVSSLLIYWKKHLFPDPAVWADSVLLAFGLGVFGVLFAITKLRKTRERFLSNP